MSKGTVYLYFKTKEAIFEGVVRRYIASTLAGIAEQATRKQLSHEARLRATLRSAYKLFTGPDIRKIVIMIVGEGDRFPELVDYYYENVIARGRDVVSSVIKDGIEAGEFRPIPVDAFPQIVIGPGVMGALWAHHFNRLSPLDLDDLYEAHMELLMGGLRKSAPDTD